MESPPSRRAAASARGGRRAEAWAARMLQHRGWVLLERNWRCRWGELDLVLAKPKRLLLVEVKARRRSGVDGGGVAAFHAAKRRRLARAWACWIADHPQWDGCSLEVVLALVPLPVDRTPVRWLRVGDLPSGCC